jgi:TP901 family phage tail tape measure protein
MAISEELLVKVTIDSKGAVSGLSQVSTSLNKFKKNADGANTVAGRLKKSFTSLGASAIVLNQGMELARKGLRAIQSVGAVTVGNFAEFETALVGVGKTANLTGDELDRLGNLAQDMSERIPVATNELLEIGKAAGQLGVKGEKNLLNFMETIARLGSASDLAGEQAALALTRLLNVTGTSIDKVDELASTVVALGNAFAASESEIVLVAQRVAQATTQFGVSAADAVALGAAMKSLGVNAELGGSAVGQAFFKINEIIKTGGRELDKFAASMGKSAAGLAKQFENKSFNSFIDFLDMLRKSGSNATVVLKNLGLQGIRTGSVLPTLAKNMELVVDAMIEARKEFGDASALIKESEAAFNTLAGQAHLLRNALTNLGTDIGEGIRPALIELLKLVTPLITQLRKLANAFFEAFGQINWQAITDAVLRLEEAFKLLGITLLAVFLPVWIPIAAAMAAFALKAALVIGAMAGIVVAVDAIGFAMKHLRKVFDAVGAMLQLAASQFKKTFLQIRLNIEDQINQIVQSITSGPINEILDKLGAPTIGKIELFDVGKTLEKSLAASAEVKANLLETVQALEAIEVDIRKEIGDTLSGTLVAEFRRFIQNFKAAAAAGGVAGDAAGGGKLDIKKQIEEAAGAVVAALSPGATKVSENILEAGQRLQDLVDGLLDALGKIFDGFIKEFPKTANFFKNLTEIMLKPFKLFNEFILEPFGEMVTESFKWVDENVLTPVIEGLIGFGKGFWKAGKTLFTEGPLAFIGVIGGFFQDNLIDPLTELFAGDTAAGVPGAGAVPLPGGGGGAGAGMITEGLADAGAAIGEAAGVVGSAVSSAIPIVGQINAAVQAGAAVVSFIGDFFQKIADLINSITDLPLKISEAFDNFLKSLLNMIRKLPVNLLKMIMGVITSIVDFIFDFMPAVLDMIDNIVNFLIDGVIKALPEIARKLVIGLFRNFITMMPAVVAAIIKAIPIIIDEFIRMIPVLIDEIIIGLKQAINELAAIFGGKIFNVDPTDMQEQLAETAKAISTQVSEALFKVSELDGSRQARNNAKAIEDAHKRGISWLERAWKEFWRLLLHWLTEFGKAFTQLVQWLAEVFTKAWQELRKAATNIWNTIVKAWRDIWAEVGRFWESIKGAATTAWHQLIGVFDRVISAFTSFVADVGQAFTEAIQGIIGAFDKVKEKLDEAWEGLKAKASEAWEGLKSGAGEAWEGLKSKSGEAWEGLKTKASEAWEGLKTALSEGGGKVKEKLNSALDKVKEPFDKLASKLQSIKEPFRKFRVGLNNFKAPMNKMVQQLKKVVAPFLALAGALANFKLPSAGDIFGGISLPGSTGGLVMHDKIKAMNIGGPVGSDRVLGSLTPGEFVLNRAAAGRIGLDNLTQMNRTGRAGSSNTTNIEMKLVVNAAGGDMNEGFVRSRLMPVIETELRRKSLRGDYILSSRGVRK